MAHEMQMAFIAEVADCFPNHFVDCRVLDIGSYNVNGSNRGFFRHCDYVGIDTKEGLGVDEICHGGDYKGYPFDTIITTEVLEHDSRWQDTLINAINLLKKHGLMVITCAAWGRPRHNAIPEIEDDYYANLTEAELVEALDPNAVFKEWEIRTVRGGKDLQFWGIKK